MNECKKVKSKIEKKIKKEKWKVHHRFFIFVKVFFILPLGFSIV